MAHVHFLLPGHFETAAAMGQSNLASVRMRVLLAVQALQEAGIRVTWGEKVTGKPDRLVVAKIGGHDIAVRQTQWLQQIDQAKRGGATIWVDYTDHHLGFPSVMSDFYQLVLGVADVFTVPSDCMRRLLMGHWHGVVHAVPDAIEVACIPPKVSCSATLTALWFGHASNMGYLRDFLEQDLRAERPLRLIVLSNPAGLELLTQRPLQARVSLEILLGEWSLDAMREAAAESDLCLIPSDVRDPRKMAVSANRLMTALALGLPTAADMLDSYAEFGAYFIDIRSNAFAGLLASPTQNRDLVEAAQRTIVPRFSRATVGAAWKQLLA